MTDRTADQRRIGELLRNPNAERMRVVERGFAAGGHADLRPPHFPILEYIDRERGSRVTYLAAHANITVQAMGELVSYLAERGYVERAPDPSDGRAKLVRLTARGHEAYALAVRLVSDLEACWTDYIGTQRMAELKQLLADLWEEIERRRDGAP